MPYSINSFEHFSQINNVENKSILKSEYDMDNINKVKIISKEIHFIRKLYKFINKEINSIN